MSPRTLLYYSPPSLGGLADYARFQANALAAHGIEVHLLARPDFASGPSDGFTLKPNLKVHARERSSLSAKLRGLQDLLAAYRRLARDIEEGGHRHVLMGSYAEYFAPLWAGQLRRLARRGVVFGSVVHDPVRDFVVGPPWWHRRSIADAYSFIREAFVHEPIVLETVRPMPQLRTTVIPHGPFTFPDATLTPEAARRKLGVPESAGLWFSFGHIRDGKNLDLVLQVLAENPQVWLLVAGKEQSAGQRKAAYYQELAQRLGVASRCVWLNRFIEPADVGNLFVASDLVLLTYSRNFRSASGVLNAAVHFHRPCLASSGQGNLRSVVENYQLGVWVEPDSAPAILEGLRRWRSCRPQPKWDAYLHDNSWRENARLVAERMFDAPPFQGAAKLPKLRTLSRARPGGEIPQALTAPSVSSAPKPPPGSTPHPA